MSVFSRSSASSSVRVTIVSTSLNERRRASVLVSASFVK